VKLSLSKINDNDEYHTASNVARKATVYNYYCYFINCFHDDEIYIVLNDFFRSVLCSGDMSEYRLKIGVFAPTSYFDPKFQVEGATRPHQPSFLSANYDILCAVTAVRMWAQVFFWFCHNPRV